MVDHISGAPFVRLLDSVQEIGWIPKAGGSDVELAMSEARLLQPNPDHSERLSLALVDRDSKRGPERKLPPFPLNLDFCVPRDEL